MLGTLLVVDAALLALAALMPSFDPVHHVLRGWLARLGHEAHSEAVSA